MFRTIPRFTILFDTPGDAGGGAGGAGGQGGAPSGSPGPGATPPAAAPASPAPSGGAAPISATPGSGVPAPSTPGQPAARRFEYPEDRSNWVPAHRLSELSTQARESRMSAERYRRMLEAGTGVNLREPERVDPAIQEARQAFESVFPGAGDFFSKALPTLMKLAQTLEQNNIQPDVFARMPDALHATDHQWQQHGRRTLDSVYSAVAQDYGMTELSQGQRRVLGTVFTDWLSQNTERQERYASSDAKLVEEFLTEYREGFVNPLRRSADAATMQRGARTAALPGAPRSGGAPPPAAQTPLTEDQVHDKAWAAFSAAR